MLPSVPDRPALYRRWRPQRFAQVVGQEHVTRTLRNAIAGGQVAHAYLLSGARGTGKTSIARLIAKALNCPKAADGEPCDTCERCVAVREGRYLDLIEIDAASNRGIDEMRDLREKVRFTPSQGQFKVYVIDEAHQLTSEAFNALLKTLEEPPPHAVFVLATTEAQRIPPTIVSRTQRFDLRRISHKAVVEQLSQIAGAEGIRVDGPALEAVARHAQGSLRDAESILDQLTAFSADGAVTLREVDELLGSSDWEEIAALFDALADDDGAAAVRLVGALVDEGRDLRLFVRRALDHLRALILVNATRRAPETLGEEAAAKIRAQAPRFSAERLARIAKRLVEAEQQLRIGEGTPLPLELAVLELTSPTPTQPGRSAGAAAAPRPSARPGSAPAERVDPNSPSAPQSSRTPTDRVDRTSPPTRDQATTPPVARISPSAGSATTPSPAPSPRERPSAQTRAPVVDLSERRAANGPAARSEAGPAEAPAVPLARVRAAWVEIVERTKERSLAKAAQLVAAEPLAVDGPTIVIGFGDDFARGMWQDRQRGELETQLSDLLGVAVRVKCVKQPGQPAQPAEDPMLRAALDTFRAPQKILEVE